MYGVISRALKCMSQILTELIGEVAKSAIIFGENNILLSVINRLGRQKISKDTEDQNNIATNLT